MHKKISLSTEAVQKAGLISSVTGLNVIDCIRDEEFRREIVIVSKGETAKIRSSVIKKLKKILNTDLEINEYSEDIEEFVKGLLSPARVLSVKTFNQNKSAVIEVEYEDKGVAIGKKGKKIKKVRLLLYRYFGVKKIKIV